MPCLELQGAPVWKEELLWRLCETSPICPSAEYVQQNDLILGMLVS